MLRRIQLIGTAALALACSLPASAAVAQQDLRMPDTRDAARGADAAEIPTHAPGIYTQQEREINRRFQGSPEYQLRVLQTRLERLERARGTAPGKGPGQDLRSPDARDAAREVPPVRIPAPVIEARELPSSGFDWGDAGIGAAGMLALFSIAAGSTLLVTNRRRRRGFQPAAH